MLHSDAPHHTRRGEAAAMLNVMLFGPLGDEFGRTVEVAIPAAGITVRGFRALLADALGPAGAKVLNPSVKVSVDCVIAVDAVLVRPGQEVAVLPVFSGG